MTDVNAHKFNCIFAEWRKTQENLTLIGMHLEPGHHLSARFIAHYFRSY